MFFDLQQILLFHYNLTSLCIKFTFHAAVCTSHPLICLCYMWIPCFNPDCCSWRSWIQECMSYSLRLHWRLNAGAEPCLSKQRHLAMHSIGGLICQRKCAGTGQTQERMTDASLCTFCCSLMLLACPLSVHCHSVCPGFSKHNYAE